MKCNYRTILCLVFLLTLGCGGGNGSDETDADADVFDDVQVDTGVEPAPDTTPDVGPEAEADVEPDAESDVTVDSYHDTETEPDGGECDIDGSIPTARVSTIQELSDAIAEAAGATDPTVLWLSPGSYPCVQIEGRAFTRDAPVIIRNNPDETGEVVFDSGGCYFNTRISSSSYIALDGVTVSGGGAGVWVEESNHIILRNLDISGQGQEGIHVRRNSSYVDILSSRIYDTGYTNPQWAECIYIGTGSSEDFPDATDYVWIENNEIFECGAAEGINVKPEVFHTTVRGNNIHDITPGTPSQYNQSALTVEGAGRAGGDYLPTEPREVWVEDNDISNVTFGEWASGIMVGGTGVYVVGNRVTSYEENGIYVNGWGNLGLFVYLFENDVDASGAVDYYLDGSVDVRETDPGPNPHAPQTWYCR